MRRFLLSAVGLLLALPAFALPAFATPAFAAPASNSPTCTVIADAATDAVLFRDGPSCDKPVSPFSTFKIALAVIGFDSGLLKDAHAPAIPYDPALNVSLEPWRHTTDPTRWMQYSVVWYSQDLTRKLGMERFSSSVDALAYGNRDVSGDPGKDNGLSRAWLSSSLKISPMAQIGFLGRLGRGELPVSAEAQALAVAVQPVFTVADGWIVRGKTGNGLQRRADGSLDEARQIGWFVGWAEKQGRRVSFARLLEEDGPREGPASFAARDTMLADLPILLASETMK